MPFQSEKQRRYMHANLPHIANKWEKKYGLGGIAGFKTGGRIGYSQGSGSDYLQYVQAMNALNLQPMPLAIFNSLRPIMSLEDLVNMGSPGKAEGGFIPAHQAGVLGLENGGEVIHNFNNYASGNNENVSVPRTFQARPHSESVELAYITPEEKGILQTLKPGTPHRGPMEIPNYDSYDAQGGYATSGQLDSPTAGDISAGVGSGGAGAGGEKTHITPLSGAAKEAWKDPEVKKARKEYKKEEKSRVKELRKDWKSWGDVKTGGTKVYQPRNWLKTLGGGILTLATMGMFGTDVAKAAKFFKRGKTIKTAWDEGEINLFGKKLDISNVKNKLTSDNQKLLASLPDGHPEKIELLSKMNIETPPTDDKGGSSIKIEEIETVNKTKAQQAKDEEYLKMQQAAYLYYLKQQKRRQAYLDNFRQMFLANKGGLAGLFRVKNS